MNNKEMSDILKLPLSTISNWRNCGNVMDWRYIMINLLDNLSTKEYLAVMGRSLDISTDGRGIYLKKINNLKEEMIYQIKEGEKIELNRLVLSERAMVTIYFRVLTLIYDTEDRDIYESSDYDISVISGDFVITMKLDSALLALSMAKINQPVLDQLFDLAKEDNYKKENLAKKSREIDKYLKTARKRLDKFSPLALKEVFFKEVIKSKNQSLSVQFYTIAYYLIYIHRICKKRNEGIEAVFNAYYEGVELRIDECIKVLNSKEELVSKEIKLKPCPSYSNLISFMRESKYTLEYRVKAEIKLGLSLECMEDYYQVVLMWNSFKAEVNLLREKGKNIDVEIDSKLINSLVNLDNKSAANTGDGAKQSKTNKDFKNNANYFSSRSIVLLQPVLQYLKNRDLHYMQKYSHDLILKTAKIPQIFFMWCDVYGTLREISGLVAKDKTLSGYCDEVRSKTMPLLNEIEEVRLLSLYLKENPSAKKEKIVGVDSELIGDYLNIASWLIDYFDALDNQSKLNLRNLGEVIYFYFNHQKKMSFIPGSNNKISVEAIGKVYREISKMDRFELNDIFGKRYMSLEFMEELFTNGLIPKSKWYLHELNIENIKGVEDERV